ncbi:3-hydroxyisobutyrate dehydrogenase-like beta-hydroxyacid dehydrogenase [Altererythrobacter atlanticus]|uniref:3-hydroxyisobutyrate dehydrogenase n=1 Tax=Croceibacterium atlanticum TaxID=1267766 RepID=A0A0F7KWL3_9SPHN|nr:NAD(P)-dependent oxidoreductase [Croceibacterium atlanticum]AKH43185.1 3-hydroxyisobutyrate dehydrogenase [Croceibacterium atlanticum]MBB5732110.1 3-hydroxyisobutyrate dehydrogenase-like beta-hydroxyacid dehydrogenase [Croceibacterium atlanticum]
MTIAGFLGLGRMGAGMSARLIGHVDHLLVHDIDPSAVAALVGQGAEAAGSAAELGKHCDIVFTSLPTPAVVRDGFAEIMSGGSPAIMCDLSTSGPRLAQELAEMLAPFGIASMDAPVSGGIARARDGTLSLMVGGLATGYERLRPLLERMGKPFYMGETPGAGQTMKLVNNLLGAVAIGVTAEGMAFGMKAGLDPARMIEVLNQSTGINSATRDKWPRSVLPRTFDFGFAAALSLKDTKLLLEEAEAMEVPLPLGAVIRTYLERTLAECGAEADFTAIARIVETDAGLDPEGPA